MPGGDRTGPRGAGPMTGRGAGYRGVYARPGYGSFGGGAGYSCRNGYPGGGHGWRNWYNSTGLTGWQRAGGWQVQPYPAGQAPGFYGQASGREEQLEALQNQAEYLDRTLTNIKRQIETLEAQKGKDSE